MNRRDFLATSAPIVAAAALAVPVLAARADATALAFNPIPPEVIALGPQWTAKWLEASPALRSMILWTAQATDDEIIALDDYFQSRRKGGAE